MCKTTNKFSPEVRKRALRLVLDTEARHPSLWQAVMSIAAKTGCTPQTLNDRVKRAEVDSGRRAGVPSEMADRMKAPERENRDQWRSHGSIIHACARKIVGWRVSTSAHAGFVLDALEQAVHDRRPGKGMGLVHHSDRGSQCLSIRDTERLAEAGIEPSVGSVGDRSDNALAETINGLFKAEVIH